MEPAWNGCLWPELKGNGGGGLESLKTHMGLSFDHHDAGEDARAAVEVIFLAEGARIHLSQTDPENQHFYYISDIAGKF